MEPLELRTHTRLWQVERRLYKLYDYTLPMPVSLRMLGIFFSTTVPWFMLMSLVNVPFAPPFGHLLWLAPPAILAWYANRPVAEGKRLGELLVSQVIFLTQAKNYAGLRPFRPDTTIRATGAVWKRLGAPDLDPNANPTPGLTAGPLT